MRIEGVTAAMEEGLAQIARGPCNRPISARAKEGYGRDGGRKPGLLRRVLSPCMPNRFRLDLSGLDVQHWTPSGMIAAFTAPRGWFARFLPALESASSGNLTAVGCICLNKWRNEAQISHITTAMPWQASSETYLILLHVHQTCSSARVCSGAVSR